MKFDRTDAQLIAGSLLFGVAYLTLTAWIVYTFFIPKIGYFGH